VSHKYVLIVASQVCFNSWYSVPYS